MFVKRTSLLTFAAVAALAMVASSAAEAFCPGVAHGSFGRGFSRSAKVVKKPAPAVRHVKAKPAVAPVRNASIVKPASIAKAQASAGIASAAPVASAAPAKVAAAPSTPIADKPAPAKPVAESTSAPAAAATDNCLIKEYLDTGAVRFRDTCSNEWAINSTKITSKVKTVGGACLAKETNSNGVVLFKDLCTSEWAMNTLEQMSIAQVK